MKNSYEVRNKPIFMWSETYLRRCFDVSEMYWISCEDIFTRASEVICGVSDLVHDSKICLPSLQPNASKLPGFQMFFNPGAWQTSSVNVKKMFFKSTMWSNLVLSGGGLAAITYFGCLKYINENKGMKQHIKNILGVSSGSIFSLLLVLGCSLDDCKSWLSLIHIWRCRRRG